MVKKNPVLYICPHCKLGFTSRTTGWADTIKHIYEAHRSKMESILSQPTKSNRDEALLTELSF
jgi:hypothetical protein